MFTLSTSIPELLLRVVIIYIFVFVLLRLVGKKHVGEMAPFDLVVLLLLSESVQNALVGEEKSVTGGLVAVAALFGVTQTIGYASWRWKKAERFLEGTPRVLMRNGRVLENVLSQEQITRSELLEALRREGCTSLGKVRYAVLENDGTITVGLRARRPQCSDRPAGPNLLTVLSPAAGSMPIHLYRNPVDFRLGAGRLMTLIDEPLRHDPCRHSLFCFVNKQ